MQSDMSRSTPKSSPYPCSSYSGCNNFRISHSWFSFLHSFFLTFNSKNWLFASLKFFIFYIINQSRALLKSTWVKSPYMFPTQTSSLATFLRLGKNFQAVPFSPPHPKNKAICLPLLKRNIYHPQKKNFAFRLMKAMKERSGPLLCKIPTNPYLPDISHCHSLLEELPSSSSHFVPVRSNWISSMSAAFICSHVWNT